MSSLVLRCRSPRALGCCLRISVASNNARIAQGSGKKGSTSRTQFNRSSRGPRFHCAVKRALPLSLFIKSRWKMRTRIARVPRASGSDARSGVDAGLARRSRLLAVTQLILLSSPLYRERLSVRCILRQNVSSADDRQAQGLIVVGSGVVLTSSG